MSNEIDHVQQIEREGFTIVGNAIEPSLLDALAEALERLEAELGARPATNLFEGLHTVRIYNLLARGAVFADVPVHANVLPIVEGVLDRGCLVSSLSSIALPNVSLMLLSSARWLRHRHAVVLRTIPPQRSPAASHRASTDRWHAR